jgi:hypothetical protein
MESSGRSRSPVATLEELAKVTSLPWNPPANSCTWRGRVRMGIGFFACRWPGARRLACFFPPDSTWPRARCGPFPGGSSLRAPALEFAAGISQPQPLARRIFVARALSPQRRPFEPTFSSSVALAIFVAGVFARGYPAPWNTLRFVFSRLLSAAKACTRKQDGALCGRCISQSQPQQKKLPQSLQPLTAPHPPSAPLPASYSIVGDSLHGTSRGADSQSATPGLLPALVSHRL